MGVNFRTCDPINCCCLRGPWSLHYKEFSPWTLVSPRTFIRHSRVSRFECFKKFCVFMIWRFRFSSNEKLINSSDILFSNFSFSFAKLAISIYFSLFDLGFESSKTNNSKLTIFSDSELWWTSMVTVQMTSIKSVTTFSMKCWPKRLYILD